MKQHLNACQFDLQDDFIYTIQFCDDEGMPWLCETAKTGELPDSMSMYKFGVDIFRSNLLDDKDKLRFKSFCQGFLENYSDDAKNLSKTQLTYKQIIQLAKDIK